MAASWIWIWAERSPKESDEEDGEGGGFWKIVAEIPTTSSFGVMAGKLRPVRNLVHDSHDWGGAGEQWRRGVYGGYGFERGVRLMSSE